MSQTLPVGAVLSERYEVKKIIGQGGMGAVYLASDRRLPVKQWAIKEMIFNYQDAREKLEIEKLFTDEAHILAQLDHPNLPKVMDFFSEDDRKYLVMEYIEGDTLEKLVMESGDFLNIEQVLHYTFQLADVLDYLHSQKPNPIIFRDLKPSNVMVTKDSRVKLIDFGIARLFVSGKDKDTIILGTPGYAPPEQYGKSQTDERSDVFGLGATLYFLLTKEDPGKSPFHFPPLSNFNKAVPRDLEEIVLKAVSISAESRYANMKEIIGELKKISLLSASTITTLLPAGVSSVPLKIEFDPGRLDFGTLKRGAIRQISFTIKGDVRGSLSSDKRWLRTKPAQVKGLNPVADAIVDTGYLRHSGNLLGNITLTTKSASSSLPVLVNVETRPLTFWNYLVALIFTIASFIPLLGFLAFFFMLWLYYSIPSEERGTFGVFMIISTAISLLYFIMLVAIIVYISMHKTRINFG